MPRITTRPKRWLLVSGSVSIAVAIYVYALFHGYFDPGKFEIKQVEWSPAKQAAMLAERSDEAALISYAYFVVLGDHLFSPIELRHAYHSDAVVIRANDDCLRLRWEGPDTLVIECNESVNPAMMPVYIDRQKRQSGKVTVHFEKHIRK